MHLLQEALKCSFYLVGHRLEIRTIEERINWEEQLFPGLSEKWAPSSPWKQGFMTARCSLLVDTDRLV